MRWAMTLLACTLACVLASYAQAELVPFPEATVVAEGVEAPKSRQFVLSAVEKNRRETAIERLVDVVAGRRWTTFEVPMGTDPDKLKEHYAAQLAGQVIFQCEGRDCGRSNTWANQIFGQAVLYGRDQEQTYLAAQVGQELVAVYLIKRGNRRQYAHVEMWQPEVMPPLVLESGDGSPWQAWLAGFARTGFAVIPQVQPQANGELTTSALTLISSLAASIPDSLSANLQLVCHLYSAPNNASDLDQDIALELTESLAASTRCAEDAAAVFASAGKTVTASGVGSLAPNKARPRARLVLIAPKRLTR